MKPTGKDRSCLSAQPCQSDRKRFQLFDSRSYGEKERLFLEKNKVDEIIKYAAMEVLKHKPANPYKFLANHFEWEFSKSNNTKKAQQLIASSDCRSPLFEDVIQQAFLILRQSKVHDNIKGINGDIYMDFMQAISSEKICEVDEFLLLENIYIPSTKVVNFRTFRAGVYSCILYCDFVNCIKLLAASLDPENAGSIPATLAQKVVKNMTEIEECKSGSTEPQNTTSYKQEYHHFNNKATKPVAKMKYRSSDGTVLVAEFISHSLDIFWNELL